MLSDQLNTMATELAVLLQSNAWDREHLHTFKDVGGTATNFLLSDLLKKHRLIEALTGNGLRFPCVSAHFLPWKQYWESALP